ncbi:protein angel homolog 2 [Nematolebias whitei]|uniref:protein angel homolog 2 n=1 Tax=Nematolebias whitei TaxID=451745 RepID=UPI00189B5FB9|nr:protein angel homolog 2 [Nematolebias whitei]
MFLRGLSSFSSSFHPRGPPALCCTNIRSSAAFSSSNPPRFIRASPPWWPVQGLPAWPPPLSHPHPSAHQFLTGRTFQALNLSSGSWRSLHTSTGRMMERPEREPPNKRWRSEEKTGGHIGASSETRGKVGESRRDYSLQPKPHFKRDLEKTTGAGDRSASREKDAEKTESEKKGRRDESPNQHSHPAGPRTQIPKSKLEPDLVPEQEPNPWFKGRAAEELGAPQRSKTGSREQLKGGGGDEAQWPGLWSKSSSSGQSPNSRQATWAPRPSPSHEISLPVKPLQRFWESCSTEPRPPGDSTLFDFSVMSYNILSQELLQDNAYLYGHCEPSVLPWDYRLPNLLTEILQLNADILCLQEVQEDHYENQIKPALQARGYQCEYKKRTGKKPDGCAVAFRTSCFSLVSSTPVEFFRPGDGLLDRDNVGLVVLLQPNKDSSQSNSSSSICVANTHLLYNPRRGDIKLAQLAILLAEISRLSRLPDGSTNPVVLCGDLNSVPWSPLYRFLTTGRLEYRGMQIGMVSGQETSPRGHRPLTSPIWSPSLGISRQCQYESRPPDESSSSSPTGGISNLTVEDLACKASAAVHSSRIEHSLKLQSSYEHRLMHDGRPEITTCHSRTALTVDYILYSSALAMSPSLPGGRGLQLLGRLSLVGQSELEEVNNLPNQHHSSDHLPLLTSFRLRF